MFELRLQRCKLGVNLLQLFLVRVGKLRASADEILVISLQQICGLGIEPELIPIVVKLLDAREQFAVEMNRVAMRGELRRHFSLDLLQRRIGVTGVEV